VDAGGRRARHPGPVLRCGHAGVQRLLAPALDLVDAYLAANDPELRIEPDLRDLAEATAASSVFAARAALAAYADLPTDRKDALTAGLSLLLARLRARRPAHRRDEPVNGEPATVEAFDVVERALELAVAWDAYRRDTTVNVRDLAQADTVEWILRRERRVVLAAHNAHVQRWPTEFPGVLGPSTTAGQHLDLRLGREYRVIGVTNGSGRTLTGGPGFLEGRFFDDLPAPPPDTLDAVMAATHDEPFGVDLHALDAADRATLAGVRTQRSGPFLCPVDPLAAYDVIVHLPRVTEARPDPAAVDAAPAEVAAVFRRRPE
jgi:erythromycin esterase